MRLLVLGANGMLGHALVEAWAARHEVWATVRGDGPTATTSAALGDRLLRGVDVRRLEDVLAALAAARPEAVVNAVGIVKQRPAASLALPAIEVNALFPHRLATACAAASARLVHVSTDCVFSGARGGYAEADPPDPRDLYGSSKLLGEVDAPGCLTLRTSMIGLELGPQRHGLVEWFLAQRGPVKGYRRAVFSGLTTLELARALEHLLARDPALSGLFHLAARPIDKCDLLQRLARRLGRRDVEVVPDDQVVCDRSLDGRALEARTAYRVPGWDEMLDALAERIRERARAR